MHLYRGPLKWKAFHGEPQRWEGPAGACLLDMRPLADQSRGGGSEIDCLFASESPIIGRDYELIASGNMHEIKASPSQRSALRVIRGRVPQGETISQLLVSLLTDCADPDGADGPKPIMPSRGKLTLLAGREIHSERFRYDGKGRSSFVKAMVQRQVRDAAKQADDGELDPKKLKKILGYELRKYGLNKEDWAEFVPPNLRKRIERADDPETTVTDDFSGTLSAWGNATGTWSIVSGAAAKTNLGNNSQTIVHQTALSGSDHYSQFQIAGGSSTTLSGASVRKVNSTTQTHYVCGNYNSILYLIKFLSGIQTNLISTSQAFSVGNTYKCEINGSSLKGYVNGTEVLSVSDSSITGNLYVAMYQFAGSASGTMDNFEGADLGAPPGGITYVQTERTTRGYLRGMYTGM